MENGTSKIKRNKSRRDAGFEHSFDLHFLAFAFVLFFFNEELLESNLGKIILGVISLFWLGRAIEQPIFWKFNDKISIAFFVIFLIGAIIFAVPLL